MDDAAQIELDSADDWQPVQLDEARCDMVGKRTVERETESIAWYGW